MDLGDPDHFPGRSVDLGNQLATYARPPLPEALFALESDDLVAVSYDPWLTFTPTGESKAGLIFYPGGRIDPRGYAPLMRVIAEEGYLVVVPSMPINMAIFDSRAADEIISHFNKINSWSIAGHSVGGTAAAMYTTKNLDIIDSLAIWASYPPDNIDFAEAKIPIYSIYGELDPRVNRQSISERKYLLPSSTIYVEISGGDHHQFGSYLTAPEENLATISRESQHEQIIGAILDLLDRAQKQNP